VAPLTSTWRRAIVPSVRAPPARKIYICMLFALSREGRCRVVKALCALSTAHPPRFLWKQGTVGSGTPSQRRGPRLCGDAGRSQHSISAQATETRSGVAARGCPHHAHRNRSSRRHTGQNRTAHSGTPARPHCSRRSGSPRPLDVTFHLGSQLQTLSAGGAALGQFLRIGTLAGASHTGFLVRRGTAVA
jgi:hypothetical protein